MEVYVVFLAVLAAIPLMALFVTHPGKTILPLYAAVVPAGSAFALAIPLPSPFNTLSSLLGAAALVAVLGNILLRRRTRVPGLAVAAWLVFLAWCAASVFWSPEPSVTVHELMIAVPLVLLVVLVAAAAFDRSDVDWMRLAIIVGGAAVGAYGLFLVATGSALPSHGLGQRFSITTAPDTTNPNQLAAALLLPLALSLHLVIEPIRWLSRAASRVIGAVAIVLTSAGVVLSGSRGGVIAGVVALVAVAMLTLQWRPSLTRTVAATLTVIFVAAVALVTMAFAAPGGILDDLDSNYAVQRIVGNETGTSGRAEIWTAGALACRTVCFEGTGLGTFSDVYSDVYAFSGVGRNVGLDRPGHNLYLSIAVELGLVGLALFLVAILAEWATLRAGVLAPALGAAIVALLVADLFEGFLWFKFFWLPFVVARMASAVPARDPVTAPAPVRVRRLDLQAPVPERA